MIVSLQDGMVTPQSYMGQLYLRYREGEGALVIVDANHIYQYFEATSRSR